MHYSRRISRWHVGNIDDHGINICCSQFSIVTQATTPVLVVNQQEYSMEEFHTIILDHKLGNIPNEQTIPTTEFADEIQNRTKLLIDKTKQNIMQSYIKCKEYYDRKAKAAPLKQNDYCFVLQLKADHQRSKIPFRDYLWVGPIIVQKMLPSENYIVR